MPPRRALTDEQVAEIREKYASGTYALSTLASRYHVSATTIFNAVKGIKRPGLKDQRPMTWDAGRGMGYDKR